jgi:hypothetical protein
MVVEPRRSLYHDPVAPGSQNVRGDVVAMPWLHLYEPGKAVLLRGRRSPAGPSGPSCRGGGSHRFLSATERGVSANELHRINNQPRRWARIGAPRYVALALAAVLQDIPPWTPPRRR